MRSEGANIDLIAHSAAMGGHIEYTEKLRAEGANIDMIAHGAAMGGHIEYTEKLRAEGANIDLIAQGAAMGGHIEYTEKLRAEGANIDLIAYGATQAGYHDYVEKLRSEGAKIDGIALGRAASGHIEYTEKLRAEGANIDMIAHGAAMGGHIEYTEKLRAEGANIDMIAYAAAMGGHIEYTEKLRAEGVNIDMIAEGAARGGYVEYAEELRKGRKDKLMKDIDGIYRSKIFDISKGEQQLRTRYQEFVNALAKHAAQGGHETYAEYLRINEKADIKEIAAGAVMGLHEKYVEKLYLLNQGITIVCILDNALLNGYMMYAERLWREHENFVNSTSYDTENKKILRKEDNLTEHFVNSLFEYGKIEDVERLRTQYNIDVNLIVKFAAFYDQEEYIISLCRGNGADVDSIKAASGVCGVSLLELTRIWAMHRRVRTSLSASVSSNVSINSSLQPHSDSATSSSSTSASSSKPALHQGLPGATKRKPMEIGNVTDTKRQRKESEPNAPTPTRTSENRSIFLNSSSPTIVNYPIVPHSPLPAFSPKKTN